MPATSATAVATDSLEHRYREELSEAPAMVPGPAVEVVPASSTEKGAVVQPLSSELAHTWLAWQCRMVAGIIRGAIYQLNDEGGIGEMLSVWPGKGEGQARLLESATKVLATGRGLVLSKKRYGPENQRTCDLVSCPLMVRGRPVAVVTAMISTRSPAQQHAVLQLLQWGGLWMDSLAQWKTDAKQEIGSLSTELLGSILGHADSSAAMMETVNYIAGLLGCERVSLGIVKSHRTELRALSGMASFDRRTQLVQRIQAAMDEALDQSATLTCPATPAGDSRILIAHAELLGDRTDGAIATVLLSTAEQSIGAITLEWAQRRELDQNSLEWIETLAAVIGPVLDLKQREERSLLTRGFGGFSRALGKIFGSEYIVLKSMLAVCALALGTFSVLPGTYRVTAPAAIESAVKQVLAAPQSGFIKQANLRAGDQVSRGQIIAELNSDDLNLELQKWQSELGKVEKAYQEALAKRDRSELSALREQKQQLHVEKRMVEEKIGRTHIKAPFDGILVSGDLSQSLGAPVEIGQVLFEVAPLESYSLVLEIDEHDMADVATGAPGKLIVAALPQSDFRFQVDQVVPVAASAEGRNFFHVEATLSEQSPLLRPGMRGVAKVELGERDLLWIWTHELIDRIRLWFWSVGF